MAIHSKWRNASAKRLVFNQDVFIREKDDPRIPGLLQSQIELVTKHLKHLESRKVELFSTKESIQDNYGHYLILTRAIERNRAQLKWLEDTLAEM